MPLTTCPDCGKQISTAADVCPQCGRPNDVVTRKIEPTGEPACYYCNRPATQRCPQCGALSCAAHLVPAGRNVVCFNCQETNLVYASYARYALAILAVALILLSIANCRPAPKKDNFEFRRPTPAPLDPANPSSPLFPRGKPIFPDKE